MASSRSTSIPTRFTPAPSAARCSRGAPSSRKARPRKRAPNRRETMTYAVGIDVGSGAVKSVLFDVQGNRQEWLAKRCVRIRRRDPMQLAREGCDGVLADAGLHADQVDYIATTGEGEN